MLEKVYTIALLHLYLLSIVRLNMNAHSCGGETSHALFGLNFSASCCCDRESEEHSADCCHDEQIVVKGSDKDQQDSKTIIISPNSNLVFQAIILAETKIDLPVTVSFKAYSEDDYPPNSAIPIYLSNRVFLI